MNSPIELYLLLLEKIFKKLYGLTGLYFLIIFLLFILLFFKNDIFDLYPTNFGLSNNNE